MDERASRGVRMVVMAGAVVFAIASAAAKPPISAKLPLPTLQVHDKAEMTQDGMTVSIAPVTSANFMTFPEIAKRITLTLQVQEKDPLTGQPTGKMVEQQQQLWWIVIALPAFKVHIVNNTGHVVRFSTAVFRLQDPTGKVYQTFSNTNELVAWNQAKITAATPDPQAQGQLLTQVNAAVGTLQLLNRNVELLKGDEWSGYLVFNLDNSKAAMDALMNVERWTLRIAEVPVEMSDAGQVTKTTEFTFAVDRTTMDVDAVCPADTKQPSWDVCTRDAP